MPYSLGCVTSTGPFRVTTERLTLSTTGPDLPQARANFGIGTLKLFPLIPAQAGIQGLRLRPLGFCFRGDERLQQRSQMNELRFSCVIFSG